MVGRNYKIETYLGPTRHSTTRYSVVLDTGASSRFIKSLLIPRELLYLIWPFEDHIGIRDAINRIVMIAVTPTLVVNVGNQTSANVKFNVVERLGTEVIFGCKFCDAHDDVIRPRQRIFEISHDTAIPITKTPPKRLPNLASILKEKKFIGPTGRESRKIYFNKTVTLETKSHNWVPVSTLQADLILQQSDERTALACSVLNFILISWWCT